MNKARVRLISLVFMALWLSFFYYAKEIKNIYKRTSFFFEENLGPLDNNELLFGREFLTPFGQIIYSVELCRRFDDYIVYTTEMRWHPMCLEDEYSADYWVKRISMEEINKKISDLSKHIYYNGADVVIIYKK